MRIIVLLLIFTFALPAASSCCEPCYDQHESSSEAESITDNCSSESDHGSEASKEFIPCICSCSQRALQASLGISATLPTTISYLFPEEILFKESNYSQPVFHPPIS